MPGGRFQSPGALGCCAVLCCPSLCCAVLCFAVFCCCVGMCVRDLPTLLKSVTVLTLEGTNGSIKFDGSVTLQSGVGIVLMDDMDGVANGASMARAGRTTFTNRV